MFDPDYHVLFWEERLYGSDPKVNHRLNSETVYKKLFESIDGDCGCLTEILTSGALKMKYPTPKISFQVVAIGNQMNRCKMFCVN